MVNGGWALEKEKEAAPASETKGEEGSHWRVGTDGWKPSSMV